MSKLRLDRMIVCNKWLGTLLLVLAACMSLAGRSEEPGNRPFGMVKINDTLYMDETEVSVGMWLAFYNWTLKHETLEAANALLPDSSAIEPAIWTFIQRSCMEFDIALRIKQTKTELDIVKVSDLKTYLGYYQTSKLSKEEAALLDVAITGVNYKQVMKFCKWRSTLFTTSNHAYRLVSLPEWKTIAQYVLAENKSDTLFKGKYPLFNYNNQLVEKWPAFKTAIQPNGMFPGNKLGLDNFFGNVSEMLMDEGKAAGGNYSLYAWQCFDSVQSYNKPQLWLGFRCIYTLSQ